MNQLPKIGHMKNKISDWCLNIGKLKLLLALDAWNAKLVD